ENGLVLVPFMLISQATLIGGPLATSLPWRAVRSPRAVSPGCDVGIGSEDLFPSGQLFADLSGAGGASGSASSERAGEVKNPGHVRTEAAIDFAKVLEGELVQRSA